MRHRSAGFYLMLALVRHAQNGIRRMHFVAIQSMTTVMKMLNLMPLDVCRWMNVETGASGNIERNVLHSLIIQLEENAISKQDQRGGNLQLTLQENVCLG